MKRDCPNKSGKQNNALNGGESKRFKDKQAEYGPCPVCDQGHSWKNQGGYSLASCRLYDCPAFMELSVVDRAVKLEVVKGCAACTAWTHQRENCNAPARACGIKEGGVEFGLNHNRTLHGTRVKYVTLRCNVQPRVPSRPMYKEWPDVNNRLVLLNMQKLVWPNGVSTLLFYDEGSTCTVITHKLAGFLGLKGTPTSQMFEVAGRDFEPLRNVQL